MPSETLPDEETVTGDIVAEPFVTDNPTTAFIFTYTDAYNESANAFIFSDPGRYTILRDQLPEPRFEPDSDLEPTNRQSKTGEVVSEVLVDKDKHTGVTVTHVTVNNDEVSTRQFTTPGMYKIVHTPTE